MSCRYLISLIVAVCLTSPAVAQYYPYYPAMRPVYAIQSQPQPGSLCFAPRPTLVGNWLFGPVPVFIPAQPPQMPGFQQPPTAVAPR